MRFFWWNKFFFCFPWNKWENYTSNTRSTPNRPKISLGTAWLRCERIIRSARLLDVSEKRGKKAKYDCSWNGLSFYCMNLVFVIWIDTITWLETVSYVHKHLAVWRHTAALFTIEISPPVSLCNRFGEIDLNVAILGIVHNSMIFFNSSVFLTSQKRFCFGLLWS